MIYLISFVILLIITAVILSFSRQTRLRQLAHTWGIRYDEKVDSPLTQESSQKVHLFNRGLHHFAHVLTWHTPGSFLRICEDTIFASPLDSAPQLRFTLATAELTQGIFPPFVLTVRTQAQQPAHAALPAELNARYVLQAPADFTLPKALIGLLRTGIPLYIEATPQALLYHEYKVFPIAQIQSLRLRVLQLVKELEQKPQPAPVETALHQTFVAPKTEAELQAEVLLRLQSHSHPAHTSGAGRLVYAFILLALLGLLCGGAWFMLHHFIPR